jgi:hypothetical protein
LGPEGDLRRTAFSRSFRGGTRFENGLFGRRVFFFGTADDSKDLDKNCEKWRKTAFRKHAFRF